MVFDYHHHLANHVESEWISDWDRIVSSWDHSDLPIKMHISSPRSEKEFRAHADYVDPEMFLTFLNEVKGSVPEIHCMIEAKQKDAALFQLVRDLKDRGDFKWLDQTNFVVE